MTLTGQSQSSIIMQQTRHWHSLEQPASFLPKKISPLMIDTSRFVCPFILGPWEMMMLLGLTQTLGVCDIGAAHRAVLSLSGGKVSLFLPIGTMWNVSLLNQATEWIQLGLLPATRPVGEQGLPCAPTWRFGMVCGCSFCGLSEAFRSSFASVNPI